ncbi:MAG: helix-hairpin-helix domain-containing protein [Saprospiraceae bacterium]
MKKSLKLPLTPTEKKNLRKNKSKIASIPNYSINELGAILEISPERAKEIHALAIFQQIPSIGIKFAEDLVFLGYFSLTELVNQDGAKLVEEYERKKGYWIDSCVEDQFRLVVHYAQTKDDSKKWWDFTAKRKQYRLTYGYPTNRPTATWHNEIVAHKKS